MKGDIRAIQDVWHWLFRTQAKTKGVTSFSDKRFYVVLCLYLAAFLLFAHDPFFFCHGAFVYQQGVVTLLLAAVIAASFNWEICLFGKPVGANLLLQVAQVFPLSLFIARITARPTVTDEPHSVIGQAWELMKGWSGSLFGDVLDEIPPWVSDLFTNWKICVLMAFVLFFLCFRSLSLKIASVVCAMVIPLVSVIVKGSVGYLFLGMVFLTAGMAMQFCRYDRILYYENVLQRLRKSASLDSLFASTALRVMTSLQDNPRMSENNLLRLVRAEYDTEEKCDLQELRLITGEVLQRLVYEYDLVVVRGDAEGLFIQANAMLYCHDSLLTQLAVFPRVALALLAALVWVLLPVDLIPDSIPFLGMLDDVTVSIFSGLILKSSMDSHIQRR